jgi:hypothetical protein
MSGPSTSTSATISTNATKSSSNPCRIIAVMGTYPSCRQIALGAVEIGIM